MQQDLYLNAGIKDEKEKEFADNVYENFDDFKPSTATEKGVLIHKKLQFLSIFFFGKL